MLSRGHQTRNPSCCSARVRKWHKFTVRGVAQVRQLPGEEPTCQPDRYGGEFLTHCSHRWAILLSRTMQHSLPRCGSLCDFCNAKSSSSTVERHLAGIGRDHGAALVYRAVIPCRSVGTSPTCRLLSSTRNKTPRSIPDRSGHPSCWPAPHSTRREMPAGTALCWLVFASMAAFRRPYAPSAVALGHPSREPRPHRDNGEGESL
jgi:hypothetical protein